MSWGQGRLDALLGVLEDLAAGEFEARAPLSDARDDLDTIALGVNALAEEVQVARGEAERHRLRLQRILDMSPSTIYACEATEPFGATFISQAVVGQFGFDPGAFLADPGFWASRIHPEDAPRIFEGLGELFEHGHHAHEYRWQRADGTWAWVHGASNKGHKYLKYNKVHYVMDRVLFAISCPHDSPLLNPTRMTGKSKAV